MIPLPLDVPVVPDAPDARRALLDELAKAPYVAAQPTLFDRISQSVRDWFASLFSGGDGAFSAWLPVMVVAMVIAVLVVALLVYGLPRLRTRSRAAAGLFGSDDDRGAEELRRAGRSAAAAGDWALAIEQAFRAIARDLDERTVVSLTPGTTAQEFARSASVAFPDSAVQLTGAARAFDGVRYLGRTGDEREYAAITALDESLRASRPALLSEVGAS